MKSRREKYRRFLKVVLGATLVFSLFYSHYYLETMIPNRIHVVVDEGYIDNIAVEPDARRHGVASALLDVYCRFGGANLAFLTLEVRSSNAPAIALYEKHGFQRAGLRPGYYQHPREDAVIMTREFARAEE